MNSKMLLKGNILKGILLFAVPLFFSQLFQTLYNTVDTVIIGYYLGENSLAAIGSTTSLFDLIVGFCVGCGNGFGIIAAQNFGAGNEKGLRKSVGQSLILSTCIGLVISVAAWLALPVILHLLNTPPEIFQEALAYIRFIVMGLLITVYYNFAAGMLRAVGDSVTPLVILGISCFLNIFMDIFCILVLKMGIVGAAFATVLAQLISTVICLIWVLKKKRLLVPDKEDYKVDKPLMKELLFQGLSMGFMQSIVAIGTVILQSAINTLGTLIIAAHTAARRLQMILSMPIFAIMTSVITFVSQNKGANQYQRIITAIRETDWIFIGYSIFMTICVIFFGKTFISWLTGSNNPEVLNTGAMYMRINVPFYWSLGILCSLRSSLQGLGKKIVPVMSSVIELVGKILFTYLIIPGTGYTGVCWCEPIIWVFMMIFLMIMYMKLDTFKAQGLKPKLL